MAAELSNKNRVCYNRFPDSIVIEEMLQNNCFEYQNSRTLLMAQQPYVFAQFLSLFSRYEFQRIVNKYNGDYHTKTFKCWHQLACMIFAHVRQEDSLRDIDIALKRPCEQTLSYRHPAMSKIHFGWRQRKARLQNLRRIRQILNAPCQTRICSNRIGLGSR